MSMYGKWRRIKTSPEAYARKALANAAANPPSSPRGPSRRGGPRSPNHSTPDARGRDGRLSHAEGVLGGEHPERPGGADRAAGAGAQLGGPADDGRPDDPRHPGGLRGRLRGRPARARHLPVRHGQLDVRRAEPRPEGVLVGEPGTRTRPPVVARLAAGGSPGAQAWRWCPRNPRRSRCSCGWTRCPSLATSPGCQERIISSAETEVNKVVQPRHRTRLARRDVGDARTRGWRRRERPRWPCCVSAAPRWSR